MKSLKAAESVIELFQVKLKTLAKDKVSCMYATPPLRRLKLIPLAPCVETSQLKARPRREAEDQVHHQREPSNCRAQRAFR